MGSYVVVQQKSRSCGTGRGEGNASKGVGEGKGGRTITFADIAAKYFFPAPPSDVDSAK